MIQKIIDILGNILGIIFMIACGLFSWCACVISSRYEEDNNNNSNNDNNDNIHK